VKASDRWFIAVLGGLVALLPVSAAFGHASSIVPHARLSAEGRQVFVEWTAAGDDVADIGVGLGLLPQEAALAFQGVGDAYPSTAQETRFARSDKLESYLLDNVHVAQQGRPCEGQVSVPDEIIAEGVRFVFSCPEQVEQVSVRVTMLHDRDEMYRTYSIDGTIWDAMHTVDQPEHVWDATLVAHDTQPSGQPLLFVGIAVALVGGGVALRWLRPIRSRRRGRP
jgi:hypothetical protein